MSDRLTFKESAIIIGTAFKTVKTRVIIWSCAGGVLFGGIMGLGLAVNQATQIDLNGERVSYTACAVADKKASPIYNGRMIVGYTYNIHTSCGEFKANFDSYQASATGETYDLTASKGNWANKPTVTSVTIAAK